MRKSLFYIILFFFGIILQFGLNQYISVCGVAPNFILLFLIYFALLRGPMTGQVLGFAWGLSWDIMSVGLFGSNTLVFTCIGFLVGNLSRKWDEQKPNSQVVLALLATILFWLGTYLVYQIFASIKFKVSIYVLVFETLLNLVLAPFVFRFFRFITDFFDVYMQRY